MALDKSDYPHVNSTEDFKDLELQEPVEGEHFWIYYGTFPYPSCRWCAVIKSRRHETPCRGITRVKLRD